MLQELDLFVRDLQFDRENLPDLLIVAIDTNCQGLSDCTKEIKHHVTNIQSFVVFALPDPHVERWFLIDSAAFHRVFGQGCKPPDRKCEKDRYKKFLLNELKRCGVTPLFGGVEYAEEIVTAMSLGRITGKVDKSLRNFIRDLRNKFNQWRSPTH